MRLITLLTLALISCTVTKTVYTENIFNSWIGRPAQELMLQQGSPARIVDDGNGGHIYVYDNSRSVTATFSAPGQLYAQPSGVAVPGSNGSVYQPSQLYYQPGGSMSSQMELEKKVEYFVGRDGVIYAWHSTGYPKTFKQKYTKEDLSSADQSLFSPPTVPR